ncbi:hypothetical protein PRIPAC_97822 [Pristionchus pacificus]|uniref:Uncharacterized protein n=1 Tax=Pristionchus pacificus TaxID=54126 RepID=A0A2A6D2V2_PRIPA|nr:hypothetical protein PRIPAC_97822 [Pristionchus pacificus]|eukprot:PDM84728.1 hypothetical protein PRIPAC_33751 [Pristionchus pacificus]
MHLLHRSLLLSLLVAVQHSHGWRNHRPSFRISSSREPGSYRPPPPKKNSDLLLARDQPPIKVPRSTVPSVHSRPVRWLGLLDAYHTKTLDRRIASYAIARDLPPGEAQRRLQILNVTNRNPNERATPCCKDTLRSGACQLMALRSHDRFLRQCRTNADFSFIQCCNSCHFADGVKLRNIDGRPFATHESLYDHDVVQLLQSTGAHWADRRGARYCEALATQNLIANPKSNSVLDMYMRMPSEHKDLRSVAGGIDLLREAPCEPTVLAFRVCKRTCGYCARSRATAIVKFNADIARDPDLCQRLF